MKLMLQVPAIAALMMSAAFANPIRLSTGDYSGGPITVDQAWENGAMSWNEYRHVHAVQYFDTIPYDPRKDPGASALRFEEFRNVIASDLQSADRNRNGRIDNETERCLFHRTPEGVAAGGIGFSTADLNEATKRRQRTIAAQRSWQGPDDWTGSGEWPKDKDFAAIAGPDQVARWSTIKGCAFMASAKIPPAAIPPAGETPPAGAPPVAPPPVAAAPACPATAADGAKAGFAAWSDGRLTRAEADQLNRNRFCQINRTRDGRMTEAQFVAQSLADFDRADKNKDGKLTGKAEIGALAAPGSPAAAGLTRKQAEDLAKLRFAVLDRKPRDGGVTVEEYLAVTAEEFAKNDANKDGALTGGEALRQGGN